MMHTLRRRTHRDEEGFTLIELMVVVLIIAILLAIAIPTFLGARGKAQARGAQSNLRNALTAEKTVFTDNSQYSDDVGQPGTLYNVEPSIKWTGGGSPDVGQVGVTVQSYNAKADNVVLTAVDASGTKCWYVTDESATGKVAPGTFYAVSDKQPGEGCPGAPDPATVDNVPNGPATSGNGWGTSW